jgi:hypothetical protein
LTGAPSNQPMAASATPIVPGQGAPFASTRRTRTLFTRWIEAKYFAGWAQGYSGNTFPSLTLTAGAAAGDQILLQLYYDQATNFVHFTAVDQTTGKTLVSTAKPAGAALYKQAILTADVSNPLPHPPPPGTSTILVPFTHGAVTTYNGTHGTGINGPWGVQQEQAINGLGQVVANAPLLYNSGTTFNVRIYG